MSRLKDIVVELHNCIHEFEPEDDIPMVWSREFQQKLAQNASHWNDDQRRASHVGNMDFQDEEDAGIGIPYHDDSAPMADPEVRIGATLDFDYEQDQRQEFKTKWGDAHRRHTIGMDHHEDERDYDALFKNWENDLDLEVGAEEEEENPYKDGEVIKAACKRCKGSGKIERFRKCPVCKGKSVRRVRSKSEEEEEGSGLNFTDDPEKVAKAKKLRDRARKARDEAVEAREKAKTQRAEEKGEAPEGEGGEGDDEWEDPDLQGVIRAVPNSHLVYKRQQEDGTFDELWHYNIGDDFKKELKIRRAVLAGTDIPINKMKSPDGSQTYELWTIGNGQMLKIQGLPN